MEWVDTGHETRLLGFWRRCALWNGGFNLNRRWSSRRCNGGFRRFENWFGWQFYGLQFCFLDWLARGPGGVGRDGRHCRSGGMRQGPGLEFWNVRDGCRGNGHGGGRAGWTGG